MHLIVLPADRIGPEITAATLAIPNAASERFALDLHMVEEAPAARLRAG